ncbi:MAG: M56 family metallopeptidase [Dermatophilaceae bacterium]|nr:M56 family metallopeptidase [Dermatophilaceae bacterium]
MSAAFCLLLYSGTLAVLAPPLLARLTRRGVAPRLGVALWLVAIGSVTGSVATAAGLLAVELARDWSGPPTTLMGSCLAGLRAAATGVHGSMVRSIVFSAAGGLMLAVGVVLLRLGRTWARARDATRAHARMVRLAGAARPSLGAVVLDVPERAVYCVPGRPSTVVFTTGALAVLDPGQVGAVLAHERAHLTGRHHLVIALTRGLCLCLPRVELFSCGAEEVARLLEMSADDAAARTHGSGTVLKALVELSSPSVPSGVPAGALAAHGVGVLARAERLAVPATARARRRATLQLATTMTAVALAPLVLGVLAVCGPLWG